MNRRGAGTVLMIVDVIFPDTPDRRTGAAPTADAPRTERPSMSRVHNGSRASRISRRRVLAIAATVGVGASAAGVAGLSLAGEKGAADTEPLVISLRDASKGTFDVFSGGSKFELTDLELANKLRKVARRG